MSIMDKFFGSGAKHASAPGTAQMPTPGNIPQGAGAAQGGTTGTAPNGVTPGIAGGAPAGGAEQTQNKSPFAEFEKLWEPATGADGKPVQVTPEPLYKVDPKTVMEAAQRTDFKSVVTPEQLQKMQAGGQEGIAAMMDAFQAMSASVYANAAVAATKIAESGITKALSQAESRLPGMIRQQQFGESLATKNPALKNPAVQPMVDMLRNQMSQKYPNATSAELQEMAERYMLSAANAFNPAANPENKQQQEREGIQKENDNWDIFFGQQSGGGGFSF
jgi:hypothetical protein